MFMKKLFVILLFFSAVFCYGQYFDYVSLGYNTVTLTDQEGGTISFYYYFLNDKQFSKMAIDPFYDSLKIEEKMTINSAEGIAIGSFLNKSDRFYLKEKEGYNFNYNERREIYRVTNGKLVYVEWGDLISKKIEYTAAGIKVTMGEKNNKYKDIYYMNFYNIPEAELNDKFMRQIISEIKGRIDYINSWGVDNRDFYENILRKLTKTELELVKNCMLTKYNYRLQSKTWIDFMKKYNNYSNGYIPMYEALEKFSFREREFMELVQKELADKYFVIGDYYRAKDNLRLRSNASISGDILKVINEDEWVTVLEEGKEETIDGITSVWVKVKLLNNKEGWCFGGYLGY